MGKLNRKAQRRLLLGLAAVFAFVNLELYVFLTRRLGNNLDGTAQAKMIDVGKYLPHEPGSALPEIHSGLQLEGELPVLDGAAALVPVYAAVIHNLYPRGSVVYEGGTFSDDNYYGENFAPESRMQYKNTVRGYRAVVDGETDLFFSAGPSEEQRSYALERGVELVYVPIGREAFVFFVNRDNPADALTSEQIRAIYAGEITDWAQAGGARRPINPVTRLKGSGSQTAMEKFMGETPFGRKSPLAVFGGSIGYSFRFYMSGIVGSDRVKMLAVDGVYPDTERIRSGDYPLTTVFYAIYRADDPNPNTARLAEWLLSEEGQALIEACGYVGIG